MEKLGNGTHLLENGDNDPSFCVEKIKIKDFGGDFEGDIFRFLIQIGKATDDYDALECLVKEYNIDVPSEFKNIDTQHTENTKSKSMGKKYYRLKATEQKTDDIYCMFDTTAFIQKPTGLEIGKIKNNIQNLEPLSYTLKGIEEAIVNGQTCIPAGIKSQDEWQDDNNFYQVFMVDVDNVKTVNNEKVKITADSEEHITIKKMLNYCEKINMIPTFVYYTFSHTEQQHKFRLVYILETATQKQAEVKGVYDSFKQIFKNYNIDFAPTNIATMFFGRTKHSL